jgi:hypothetical protein
VLQAGLAVATNEVEEYIDGGPHGERYRQVRQRPPLRSKMMSMMGLMGGAACGSGSGHHRC